MSWHKIPLNDEDVKKGEVEKITNIFYDIINAYHEEARHSHGVVIFEGKEKDKHFIYFSPESLKIETLADLINIYNGLICKPPFKGTVHYLAGDINYARYFL